MVTIDSKGTMTLKAPMIKLDAGIVQVTGLLAVDGGADIKAMTLVQALLAQSVSSPMYTPGVGNLQ